MPDNSPILSLPLILPAQAQKHVTHNEALRMLDVIVQLSVLTRSLTVPPALPSVGDRHIVPASATGDWAGQTGRIAVYVTTGWEFHQPLAGWQAHVLTEAQTAVFNGLVWNAPSDGAVAVARLGVSATADSTNRLSVASPATLLSHAGAGHQVKVNKAATADTASLLFQTGFSGRAEIGTAGDDDFAIKVSDDGTAFDTALSVDAGTGEVTLPQPVHLGGQASDPATPGDGTLWLNTTTGEIKVRSAGATVALGAAGGGVSDGDKGDVVVSGTGAVWTVDAGAITLAKMADIATDSLIGRDSAGTGAPEVLGAAAVRGILNVADGATANASDAALRDRTTHTGTQAAATITGLATIATSGLATDLGGTLGAAQFDDASHGGRAGGGLHAVATTTVAGFMAAADKTKLDGIAAGAEVNVGTDLAYTAPTRVLASSTGADVTLPLVTSGDAGLAPASGGGTANFLRADGTWAAPAGGGGGSGDVVGPASATDNAIVRFDATTGKLIQNSTVVVTDAGGITLPLVVSPASPAADTVTVFARKIANRMFPAFIGPSGLDTSVQPLMARNKVGYWCPPGNGTTVPGVLGFVAPTTTGFTATSRNAAVTNLFTRMRRLGYVTAATAGSVGQWRSTTQQFTISNGSGLGGFTYIVRFGISDAAAVAGARMAMGMSSAGAPTNVEPGTLTNCVLLGHGAANTTMQVFFGGSAAQTPIDLGANFPADTRSVDMYEFALFAPTNTQVVHWEVTRLNTGHMASGTLSGTVGTQIPGASTLLTYWGYRTNNATALAVGMDVASAYIETDY